MPIGNAGILSHTHTHTQETGDQTTEVTAIWVCFFLCVCVFQLNKGKPLCLRPVLRLWALDCLEKGFHVFTFIRSFKDASRRSVTEHKGSPELQQMIILHMLIVELPDFSNINPAKLSSLLFLSLFCKTLFNNKFWSSSFTANSTTEESKCPKLKTSINSVFSLNTNKIQYIWSSNRETKVPLIFE